MVHLIKQLVIPEKDRSFHNFIFKRNCINNRIVRCRIIDHFKIETSALHHTHGFLIEGQLEHFEREKIN